MARAGALSGAYLASLFSSFLMAFPCLLANAGESLHGVSPATSAMASWIGDVASTAARARAVAIFLAPSFCSGFAALGFAEQETRDLQGRTGANRDAGELAKQEDLVEDRSLRGVERPEGVMNVSVEAAIAQHYTALNCTDLIWCCSVLNQKVLYVCEERQRERGEDLLLFLLSY